MFPSPGLAAPALALNQFSYRGLTFGGTTHGLTYSLASLKKGREPVAAESGDQQRALDQGQFIGLDVLPGRDIEIETIVQASTASELDKAIQTLSAVMAYGANVEEPLYLQLPSGIFACMCRPRKHAPVTGAIDVTTILAKAGVYLTMLHATDPRWYAVPTKTATVGLPAPLGGLTFNVTFNASFGGGGAGGILEVLNNGMFEMRPILIVKGPCTNPVITNLTLPGAPSIGFSITLAEGERP